MRDLLYKNLTSNDKKKKVIASSEIVDNQGIHSVIRRHFVCLVREVKNNQMEKPVPYMYVLKVRDNREQSEKFYCRIKGSVHAVFKGKVFLVIFSHSLKIVLSANNGLKRPNLAGGRF